MKISSLFLLAILLTAGTTPLFAQKVRGNGNVTTQDRPATSFNEVRSQGSFDVVVTDGSDTKVKVEAEENLQSLIETEVEGSTLYIRPKKFSNFNSTKNITIYVTAHGLKGIHLSGSGNVKSTNTLTGSDEFQLKSSGSGNTDVDVETNSLSVAISGSGNMKLKGKTKDLDGSISGSGNIRAKDMQSENTSIKISGSGSAEVVATQKLDTKIAGSGDVRYWGNAQVNSKVAGSGSVSKQN